MRRRLILGLLAVACGPDNAKQPDGDEADRYADAFCSATAKCGCQPRYGEGEQCHDEMAGRFSEALDAGFTLDVECFEKVVDDGHLDDCTPVLTWAFDDWFCPVLRGTKKHAEPCDPVLDSLPPFDMDECEKGLRCIDAICMTYDESGPARAEGESCSAQEPGSCHGGMLYCSSNAVCEPAPLVGEPCTSNDACLAGTSNGTLYCAGLGGAGAGICSTRLADGGSCDPRDTIACQGDGAYYGWCDPSTNTCRSKGPAICEADDYQVSLHGALE